MEFGVAIFPTEDVQEPAELARMAEDRGFESLFFPEHTHIPASRETPPHVIDRVLAFGDEWMPNRVSGDAEMIARFDELTARAADVGRAPVPVTLAGLMRDPARLERLEHAGVHRGLFWLPARSRGEVEQAFERYAAAVQEFRGAGG